MKEHFPSRSPGPRLSAWIVFVMLAMVFVPAAITLNTVRSPAYIRMTSADPTPHGYTWSLLLFLIPIVVIAFGLLPREEIKIPRKAFWWTIGILVPVGFATDFFFASRFFVFLNPGATLSEYWLAAYNQADYRAESKKIDRLLQFHPTSMIVGIALVGAAIFYKKTLSPDHEGFPEYFTFLVAVGFVPAIAFFPIARRFINWRAFSLTLFFILLVSLLWEATLAVPYQWWDYQPKQ